MTRSGERNIANSVLLLLTYNVNFSGSAGEAQYRQESQMDVDEIPVVPTDGNELEMESSGKLIHSKE